MRGHIRICMFGAPKHLGCNLCGSFSSEELALSQGKPAFEDATVFSQYKGLLPRQGLAACNRTSLSPFNLVVASCAPRRTRQMNGTYLAIQNTEHSHHCKLQLLERHSVLALHVCELAD